MNEASHQMLIETHTKIHAFGGTGNYEISESRNDFIFAYVLSK